jgi:RNA polymerase sigma factor (sigma-70 family)
VNATPDQQLLSDYAENRAETAFAELVRRHIDLVHSAAFRLTGEAHSAQDVTQAVFLALANNAARLASHPVLPGWLHTTTRHLAAKTIRAAVRRQTREQEAAAMHELLSPEPDLPWDELAPHLDAALGELSEPERDAVLLRYFEKKTAPEIAAALGIGTDAAQKRVNRAVDRLRDLLAKRGIKAGAAGLATLLSTQAVQAAPLGLAAAVSSAALLSAGTGAGVGLAAAAKTIAMTTLQKSLVTATLALSLGFGVYEVSQSSRLTDRLAALEQTEAQARLAAERRLASLAADNTRLHAEADRLNAEALAAAQARTADAATAQDPSLRAMADWLERVQTLKDRMKARPETAIPEMRWLKEEDWLAAAKNPLANEDDFRRAAHVLRSNAENKFSNKAFPALQRYLKEHDNKFLTDLAQLQPYFDAPLDPAILERWTILPAKDVHNINMGGDWVITQKAAVDNELDQRTAIGARGYGSAGNGFNPDTQYLEATAKAFAKANPGRQPTGIEDLVPYATTPQQKAALNHVLAAQKAAAK